MKRERKSEKRGKREKEGRKNRRYRGEKVTRLIASAEHDQPPPRRVLVLFIPVIAPSSERASLSRFFHVPALVSPRFMPGIINYFLPEEISS